MAELVVAPAAVARPQPELAVGPELQLPAVVVVRPRCAGWRAAAARTPGRRRRIGGRARYSRTWISPGGPARRRRGLRRRSARRSRSRARRPPRAARARSPRDSVIDGQVEQRRGERPSPSRITRTCARLLGHEHARRVTRRGAVAYGRRRRSRRPSPAPAPPERPARHASQAAISAPPHAHPSGSSGSPRASHRQQASRHRVRLIARAAERVGGHRRAPADAAVEDDRRLAVDRLRLRR